MYAAPTRLSISVTSKVVGKGYTNSSTSSSTRAFSSFSPPAFCSPDDFRLRLQAEKSISPAPSRATRLLGLKSFLIAMAVFIVSTNIKDNNLLCTAGPALFSRGNQSVHPRKENPNRAPSTEACFCHAPRFLRARKPHQRADRS